ncbi:MAG TPA: FAD-dependent oxidoreductase [Gemmataceae bacterium]|jgi:glycine oxidase|nr:FAD-dependent oxidoreductase [Gemmataceae bacterium]
MSRVPDVLVIGGGVIGLTSAYQLARAGCSVRLFDRGAFGAEASWAGAGIIPPGNPAGARTAYDRLRATSSTSFSAFSAELRDRTGIDNGYRVCGGVELFECDAAETTDLWLKEGIRFEPLDDGGRRRVEPGLGRTTADAVYLPDMAQVRNPWHIRSLVEACRHVGVDLKANVPVADFEVRGGRIVHATDIYGENHTADNFLIAGGAWSEELLQTLGVHPGIHPVLGQIVLFAPPRPVLRRIVSVDKRYLVPRDDGRVLAGATEEPEAGFEKRNTPEGVGGLMEFARELVPALATAPVEKTWSGLRPGSPDGLPFLGPVPGLRNAFAACGHFRAGIQLSIGTAGVLTDLITGRPSTVPVDDFRLDRPPAPPFPAAFRS